MLKKFRIAFAVIAATAFTGWWVLRKPYSPSDELPRVYYPAFEVAGIDTGVGQKLAQTVRNWDGINAAAYNNKSALLSLACMEGTNETTLIANLEKAAGTTVTKKIFTEPAGPKCPVSPEAVQRIPLYLLVTGYISLILSLFTFFPFLSKK